MPARTPRAPLGIALERAGGGMERVSCVCALRVRKSLITRTRKT